MKNKYSLIFVLFLSFVYAKPHVLKIDEIIEISLKYSPDIDSSRFDFEAAGQRTKIAQGFYLPRVDISADAGEQWFKLQKQASDNANILAGQLGASQLLYDFEKTEGSLQSSKKEELALEAQMQQVISDKILLVKNIYYDVLKAKSIIDVQRKNILLQKQQLKRAEKYLQAGIKTIIDVSDAKVKVQQAKLDLKNAKYELELQRATLEEAMGYVPYGGNYILYSQKLSASNLSKRLPVLKMSLQKLETFAYAHRYVLQSSEHYVKGAQENVSASQGEYYPTFSLKGDYALQDVDSASIGITPEQQGQITVNMTWNLFSGYQTDASVQEAKIAVLKANSQVQSVRLAIKKEVLESHINVRRNKDTVVLSESIAGLSLQKFGQAEKRYENELSDYVELQDAQQEYIQALSDLVNAYYDYFIAMATLDHAVGR
ncbi:MAG: hypothetical protein DRQ78_07230 [Epsilonproteobacteria bacterium]|nr:MAG: hypothetical protein DRQ78_07230 [Campylobacterota bacterium]